MQETVWGGVESVREDDEMSGRGHDPGTEELALRCVRMAEAMDAWGIGIYDHDHVTGAVYASPRFREHYGFGPNEKVTVGVLSQCVHPADRVSGIHEVLKAHDPAGDGKFDLLYRIVRKDGQVRWIHSRSTTSFGVVDGKESALRTLGSVQDVTEHQELEVVVQRQRIRLEQAMATSAVGIFELDHRPSYDSDGVYLSETFSQLTGLRDEFSRDFSTYLVRVHEDDRQRVAESFERLLSPDGPGHLEVEHRYRRAQDDVRWLLLRASTKFETKEPSPGPLLTVGALLDVTSIQEAKKELAERSAILDATPDFVCIARPDGKLVYLNQAGRELFGLAPGEHLEKHNMEEVHSPQTNHFIRTEVLPLVSQKRVWRGETTFIDHRKREIPMSQVILPHHGGREGELRFSTIARNLSKEKELEEQFRQAQKMEAVGQLAGGVAHDFNNLLSVVLGFTDLGSKRISGGGSAEQCFFEIRVAAERASALTNQLLAFSRRQIMQTHVVDVGELLSRAAPMLRRAIDERVEFSMQLPTSPLRIKADPTQIEQILLNLTVNARDAMPEGGQLHFDVFETTVKEDDRDVDLDCGRYVAITVKDSGHGMDEATRDRIFEPFFTTKERDKGTGLGLSTVFGIVRQSGGSIAVRSEPGAGSVFEILFPATDELESKDEGTPRAPVDVGRATILLAEDDVQVRRMLVSVLEEAGLFVLEAEGPVEALRLAETVDGSIELLLTDVVMPHMTGRELAEKVCQRRPEVQVIYMSGYTEDSIVSHGVLDKGIHFLPKPISTQSLLAAIKQVLA